jgi:hypothetical protein
MVDPLTSTVVVSAAVQAVKDAGSRVLGRIVAETTRVEVSWSQSAIEDLRALDQSLARTILQAAVRELKQHPDPSDPNEGRIREDLLWRRAVVPDDDQASATSKVPSPDGAHIPSYILIYRLRDSDEKVQSGGRPGFVVLRVIPAEVLADLMRKPNATSTPSQATPNEAD